MSKAPAASDLIVLLEPLIPALRRYAYALLRDHAAADDLVQDALEHAIGSWRQRRSDRDARSWMFAIVHNLAANRLRQLSRRGVHVPLEEVHEAAVARGPEQEGALIRRDILKVMRALPDEHRAVLLLVSVEGFSYAEVAQVLGVPVGTVMSRLARARDRLFQLMEAGPAEAERPRPRLRRIK